MSRTRFDLVAEVADAGSAPLLRAADLAKSYGGRPVFDGVALAAAPGQRLGLVGENGAGKSTLLGLLAGEVEADGGTVERPPETGYLRQEAPFTDADTIAGVVEAALAPSREVERLLSERASALDGADSAATADYAETLALAEALDVWGADQRAELVLAGLGLGGTDRERSVGALSGGQRSRLALAALLIRRPRALLLDEPTNHLDDDAVGFLEEYLTALPGVVVLASHDRAFLDAVCTGLLDLDPAVDGPVSYGGAYTYYLEAKRKERARWEQRYAAEQEELKELRESVQTTARNVSLGRPRGNQAKILYDFKGSRVDKQVSRRIRNAQRRLDELEGSQVRKPPRPLSFSGTLTGEAPASGLALTARRIDVGDRLRLDELDLPADGRLLVTGANGAGKSTLLSVLAGRLDPGPQGAVQWLGGAKVALLEQDVVFRDPEATPRARYAAAAPAGAPPLSDLGLIAPGDADRPLGLLSVGQRRRLALALLIAVQPQVLLLDEPTNHLSLSLAEELEAALQTAPGAVVIASHDRWLRRRWTGAQLHLAQGRPVP
ncbi:ABC-F family ATP-binding cassette domain-containing protein [Nocardiopsis coralliicola]